MSQSDPVWGGAFLGVFVPPFNGNIKAASAKSRFAVSLSDHVVASLCLAFKNLVHLGRVMLFTKTFAPLRLAANSAKIIGAVRLPVFHQGENDQVFNSVVRLVPIDVMDMLRFKERPSNFIRHHQAMLKYVASRVCVWMRFSFNERVSLNIGCDPFGHAVNSASLKPLFKARPTPSLHFPRLIPVSDKSAVNTFNSHCSMMPAI